MSYDFNDSLAACENVLKYDFEKDWNGQPTTDKHKIETLEYCQVRIDDVEEQFNYFQFCHHLTYPHPKLQNKVIKINQFLLFLQ